MNNLDHLIKDSKIQQFIKENEQSNNSNNNANGLIWKPVAPAGIRTYEIKEVRRVKAKRSDSESIELEAILLNETTNEPEFITTFRFVISDRNGNTIKYGDDLLTALSIVVLQKSPASLKLTPSSRTYTAGGVQNEVKFDCYRDFEGLKVLICNYPSMADAYNDKTKYRTQNNIKELFNNMTFTALEMLSGFSEPKRFKYWVDKYKPTDIEDLREESLQYLDNNTNQSSNNFAKNAVANNNLPKSISVSTEELDF